MMMMKLSLVSLVLLLPFATAIIKRCPHESLITPCTCAEHYAWGSEVTCKDFNNTDTLQKVFDETNTYGFDMLNLESCVIPYLKNTWISSKGIYKLQIRNVTTYDLFQNEGDATAPSLTVMIFKTVKVLRKVRWQQLKPFNRLKELTMANTEVKSLGKDFKEGVSSTLEFLSIDGARLAALEDGDLEGKTVLRSMSFKNNKIKVLKNSVFNDQRTVVATLDFSYNPIASIPGEIFEGMTALRYVYIKGAQLKTVSKISNFRGYLNIGENPLVCDCNMKWVINNKDFFVEGTCEAPGFLKSKSFSALTQDDFGACRNRLPFNH